MPLTHLLSLGRVMNWSAALQSIPVIFLVGYTFFMWNRILLTLALIAFLYSTLKNLVYVLTDSTKLPFSAFPMLIFYDIWMGMVHVSRMFAVDMQYPRAILDAIVRAGGRSCAHTHVQKEVTEEGVELHVNRPEGVSSSRNCLLFIHGGGWTFLSARCYNACVSWLAHLLQCVIVNVEYRLTPEHPFPAGLDDCYSALRWVWANAELLDIERVFVGGDSAGGNLSAALCLLHRDTRKESPGLREIAGQILLYPVLQAFDMTRGSMAENAHLFPRASLMPACVSNYVVGGEGLSHYFGQPEQHTKVPRFCKVVLKDDREVLEHKSSLSVGDYTQESILGNGYILPLHAGDVSNLPPAYISLATGDTLRDEGEWYAEYLRASGCSAQVSLVRHVHGFINGCAKDSEVRKEVEKIRVFMEKIAE